MNPMAVLGLIGDLFARLSAALEEAAGLRVRVGELEAQLAAVQQANGKAVARAPG